MATLPPVRRQAPFPGAEKFIVHSGKVRDTLAVPDQTRTLIQVASDGVSIFDFVLNALVPFKGEVLTALTIFWAQMLKAYGVHHHLLWEKGGVKDAIRNWTFPEEILPRAVAVHKLRMLPVEFIARAHLTGSALPFYVKHGNVYGHVLPPGLRDGDRLPYFLDTPTTKSEDGHDEPMNPKTVAGEYPEATLQLLRIFSIMHNYAHSRGIILADTKLEFGMEADWVHLADEFGTPDSSRFWSLREWEELQRKGAGRAPTSLDKELVRQWGKKIETRFNVVGINKLDPQNPEHVAFVHSLEVPEDVIHRTSQTYRYISWLLTGKKLEAFQREEMGLSVSMPRPRVEVILGSRSDIEAAKPGLTILRNALPESYVHVHIASCHRNLTELIAYAEKADCDVIIAGAGKAAALPGMIDTLLREKGKRIPVVGVGFGQEGTQSFEAARLSIEEVPGNPLVTKENGSAYMGVKGFEEACRRVIEGELPPWQPREMKPAEWNLPRGV